MLSKEKRARLHAELPAIYASLAAAALNLVKKRRQPGSATTARDLLHNAIAALLSGDRDWPDGVELFACLIEVMRSLRANQARSDKRQKTEPEPIPERPGVPKRVDVPAGGHEMNHPFWTREREREIRLAAREAAAGNPTALAIVDAALKGAGRGAELAEDTGIDVNEVYEGVRYLKGRLTPIVEGWRRHDEEKD